MGTNFNFVGEMPEEIRQQTEQLETFQQNRGRYPPMPSPRYWNDEQYGQHIGKRSAAGLYCWTCMEKVNNHDGNNECPTCGASYEPQSIHDPGNAAGMELGFAKPRETRPKGGVNTVSKFLWAINADTFRDWASRNPDELIADEYGRTFTAAEFIAMVDANCPLESHDSVGVPFS